MRHLVIIGASGFGRETVDIAWAVHRETGSVSLRGIIDDGPSAEDLERLRSVGIAYLGTTAQLADHRWRRDTEFVVSIGDPSIRRRVTRDFLAEGWSPATLVHPSVGVGHSTHFGDGAVVAAGVQVSNNVSIGDHVHVNPNATIGHDTELHDFVSINPGAVVSGSCVVEECALVGAGAVILQGLRVGREATVGAAACVVKAVPSGATVKGVPAR